MTVESTINALTSSILKDLLETKSHRRLRVIHIKVVY